ncbi:MAG: thioesterase family protein [Gammaproteobacteria bacterium]
MSNSNSTSDAIPTPYVYAGTVKERWLDDNGHMNVAYYMSAFDDGGEVFFADPGIGWEYTRQNVGTVFVISSKVDYFNELLAGASFSVTSRLMDFTPKMLHVYYEMLNAGNDLCARAEILYMHVLFANRKSAPMPQPVLQRLEHIQSAHKKLPTPDGLGLGVGIRK